MDYYQMSDITDEERNGITELRRRLEKEMSPKMLRDSSIFVRFLRARDGNINKATEMLKNNIEWRKKTDIDNDQNFQLPEVMKYMPVTHIGFTKSGNVLRYVDAGNCDIRGILKSVKNEVLMRSVRKIAESDVDIMLNQSEKLGKVIDKWVAVFNVENLPFALATNLGALQFTIMIAKIYEAHYPERLHTLMFINVPPYFALVYNVLKSLTTARTLKKLSVYTKDGWKEELLKLVDADVLPVFLGGTRTDENGDPLCSSFIISGRPVPESYYLRSPLRRLNNQPDTRKLKVSRMSETKVELDVETAGDFIEWQFETESGDIAFALFMEVLGKSENSTLKEIIPKQRVEANIACETGTYLCDEPGKYILQFDNSHSWFRGKEVYYRVEVVKPASENLP